MTDTPQDGNGTQPIAGEVEPLPGAPADKAPDIPVEGEGSNHNSAANGTSTGSPITEEPTSGGRRSRALLRRTDL